MNKFSIGLDFGTNSVRVLLIDVSNGDEIASYVANYKSGTAGVITDSKDSNIARQNPNDWLVGMEEAVKKVLSIASKNKSFRSDDIIGIGVDTTGSTPLPVDEEGTPLAFHRKFKNNKNALAWLWKDHSGHAEAEEITKLARKEHPEYLAKCGGVYSSEWFFSKILHCLHVDRKVFDAAYSWVEFADYIPAVLTGITPLKIKRSVCAAGHKAMYNENWGGLPSPDFLMKLHPKFADLRKHRLYKKAYTSDIPAGRLSSVWAEKLGLSENITVAVGAFDAHMGAVGAGIKSGVLVKIIGTSTCDMMVVPNEEKIADIPGLCGIVDGSILPEYFGLEAGQSAVGDIFNWFINNFVPPYYHKEAESKGVDIHTLLTKKADKLKPGQSGLLALDWNNGNRTVLVDARLTGLIIGQTLHTKPEEIYRALIEATGFGAKVIINRFEEYGVKVREVINCGGIAEKNPLLMQIYADIFNRPMKISRSSQTCALGAAIFASVAGGIYKNTEEAQEAICGLKKTAYNPIPNNNNIAYDKLYTLYKELHDSFGTKTYNNNLFHVMKELLKIKEKAIYGKS
jgi:L-ribulokinase